MQSLHNDVGTHTIHSAQAVPASARANDKLPIGLGRSRCLLKATRADDSCISIHQMAVVVVVDRSITTLIVLGPFHSIDGSTLPSYPAP
jgi:hypothetical protein